MATEHCVLLVLGAGLSRRFGEEDKLEAMIGPHRLAHHILHTTHALPWQEKRLVCRAEGLWQENYSKAGFRRLINPAPAHGLGSSLALGIAGLAPTARVLVCLADMPFISAAHLTALCTASHAEPETVFATSSVSYRGPPAIFPVAALKTLDPNSAHGARPLLRSARLITIPADNACDIDHRADALEANKRSLPMF